MTILSGNARHVLYDAAVTIAKSLKPSFKVPKMGNNGTTTDNFMARA
jgi:hypothetical protein